MDIVFSEMSNEKTKGRKEKICRHFRSAMIEFLNTSLFLSSMFFVFKYESVCYSLVKSWCMRLWFGYLPICAWLFWE